MSLAHSQGLRDALHKLRDTYYPPTAEEVRLFTAVLTSDELQPASTTEVVCLRPEMPVPVPTYHQSEFANNVSAPRPSTSHTRLRKSPKFYSAEEVETRW